MWCYDGEYERGRREAQVTDALARMVAPLYAWFTDGLDTPDFIAATALLEEG